MVVRIFILLALVLFPLSSRGDEPERWQALYDAADQAFANNRFEEALEGFRNALGAAESEEERLASERAILTSLIWGGKLEAAREYALTLIESYEQDGNTSALIYALGQQAFILANLGEGELAGAYESRASELGGGLNPFVWRLDEESGDYIHIATGMAFATSIGGYDRHFVTHYNATGERVEIGYENENANGKFNIKVVLQYAPDTPYLNYADREMRNIRMLPGEENFLHSNFYAWVVNGKGLNARRYNIELDRYLGDERRHRLDQWFLPIDDWYLAITHTYLQAASQAATSQFDEFLKAFPWPQSLPSLSASAAGVKQTPALSARLAELVEMADEEYDEFAAELDSLIEKGELSRFELSTAYRKKSVGLLIALQDNEQAMSLAMKAATITPESFDAWWYAVSVAAFIKDYLHGAEALKSIATHLPDEVNRIKNRELWQIVWGLKEDGHAEVYESLLWALYNAKFVGNEPVSGRNFLYLRLIDILLERGDVDQAAEMAGGLQGIDVWVPLLVNKDFDPIWESGALEMDATLAGLADSELRYRMDVAMTFPRTVEALQLVMRALAMSGQVKAAENIGVNAAANIAAYEGTTENWLWFFNELAFVFENTGQFERATGTMKSLMGVDFNEDSSVVSQIINYAGMLRRLGDPAEALEVVRELDGAGPVSEYGQRWIDSIAVCAHQDLGNEKASIERLGILLENDEDNYAAAMMALLCLDRHEEAVQLARKRLNDKDARSDMLEAFAEYIEPDSQSENARIMQQRLMAVRDDPAVMADIARFGRIVKFPVTRGYWGEF